MANKFPILPVEAHSEASSCGGMRVSQDPARQMVPPKKFQGRAAVITLGCAKNEVDSEVMLGVLSAAGYEIVDDLAAADVAVVNTCGFLQSAVEESIDAVLDAASYKKNGRLRRLIVAGCMVERYQSDLKSELPEVDAFLTTNQFTQVADAASDGFLQALSDSARPYFLYDDTTPRYLSGKGHFAYVKISEGCNRPCTFCIIPRIRGAMRSRTIDSIVNEVRRLGDQGVREVNLVGQDLTAFGTDRGSRELESLLRRLDESRSVPWIRLLYSYPIGIDASLLRTIADLPTICDYLDLPLQHSSLSVLKSMKRPVGKYAAREIVAFIRQVAPELALRTTFIVGYPGETEDDVRDLESFVREGHFSSVGVFQYSPESGSPAAELDGQIQPELKSERFERVMLAQQEAMESRLDEFIGQRLEVLVEGAHPETELLLSARSRFQAPDVDGMVIINEFQDESLSFDSPSSQLLESGDHTSGFDQKSIPSSGALGQVHITERVGYDLLGTWIQPE